MKKLLSITLSFCLLFAQVVPAWAEVAPLPVQQTSATIQTLVGAEMDQEQAKVFLDAIAQWLQEIENEVKGATGQTEAFKQLLNGEEPPAKDADEKKLDQQIVQALINIYDKGKPKSAAFQDAFNSTRAKAYLTTLLPSMFSSLEQGTVLHGNAFVFLNDQLSAGGYDACSKEGEAAAAVCEKQLTAADALSGIWSQLTEPEKEAEGLPQLIARTVKGPYATSALQMAIPLVISGQSPGKIFAAEEEQMGVWDVVMEVAGAFSLTNLLTANIPEDLWVKGKDATYYQREGFGNYFNAWTDLGRAWGFKALQDRNSQIAKELNKVVDQLLKGGGLYRKGYNGKLVSIYDTVKKIENNKTKNAGMLDQELYYESDKFCPGASIAMKIVIDTRTVGDGGQDLSAGDGKIETYTCHNVADPLYPFIVGVFSTGYVPPGYEKKYLLAFLRRSYNRGQEYMGPNTATYMNNLIALGYYTLGGAVPKGVNGKGDNYTCQSGASADTMCQRSSAPKDNVERQEAFIAAHRVLSGLDLAMAAYGLFSLGKMIVTGVARARAVIALVKATDKEVKAVYGSWRYVKAAFKATKRANGVDLYKKFVELDKRAAKAMRNIADDADDAAKVADDAAKAATSKGTGTPPNTSTGGGTQNPGRVNQGGGQGGSGGTGTGGRVVDGGGTGGTGGTGGHGQSVVDDAVIARKAEEAKPIFLENSMGESLEVPGEFKQKTLKELEKEARALRKQGKVAEAKKIEDFVAKSKKFGIEPKQRFTDFDTKGSGPIKRVDPSATKTPSKFNRAGQQYKNKFSATEQERITRFEQSASDGEIEAWNRLSEIDKSSRFSGDPTNKAFLDKVREELLSGEFRKNPANLRKLNNFAEKIRKLEGFNTEGNFWKIYAGDAELTIAEIESRSVVDVLTQIDKGAWYFGCEVSIPEAGLVDGMFYWAEGPYGQLKLAVRPGGISPSKYNAQINRIIQEVRMKYPKAKSIRVRLGNHELGDGGTQLLNPNELHMHIEVITEDGILMNNTAYMDIRNVNMSEGSRTLEGMFKHLRDSEKDLSEIKDAINKAGKLKSRDLNPAEAPAIRQRFEAAKQWVETIEQEVKLTQKDINAIFNRRVQVQELDNWLNDLEGIKKLDNYNLVP